MACGYETRAPLGMEKLMFSSDGLLSCLHTDMAVAAEPTANFVSAGESYSYNFCLVTNASKLATQLGSRKKKQRVNLCLALLLFQDFIFVTISAVSGTVYVVSSKRVEVRLFCLGRLGRQDFWCRRPCAPISFDSPSQTSTRSRVDIFRVRSTGCVGMFTFCATF